MLGSVPLQAQEFEPFRATNLNPPIAIIGLPIWSVVPEAMDYGFSVELANHYRLSQRGDDSLILDGETFRLRAFLEAPVGEHWSLGVDVPVYHQSGGVLDDLVDAWHSAFSLPDGGRNARPEGALEFRMADAGGEFFTLTESSSGIGDIQISGARRLGASGAWTLRAAVKLPTGRETILAGSGETDFSLSALRFGRLQFKAREASYFVGAAWIETGRPQQIDYPIEDRAFAAVIGGALALGSRFGIKAQIDVNSALYQTELEEIGQPAVQATIGGWLDFAGSMLFEYAVSEDLHVSTTPDVVILLGLRARRQ